METLQGKEPLEKWSWTAAEYSPQAPTNANGESAIFAIANLVAMLHGEKIADSPRPS